MTGIVSLPLISLCTPIPCSLTLGQRLSLTFLSLAYLIPIPSCYYLGTYPVRIGRQLLFVPSLLFCTSIVLLVAIVFGILIHRCYCLALPEVWIYCLYCSQLR